MTAKRIGSGAHHYPPKKEPGAQAPGAVAGDVIRSEPPGTAVSGRPVRHSFSDGGSLVRRPTCPP